MNMDHLSHFGPFTLCFTGTWSPSTLISETSLAIGSADLHALRRVAAALLYMTLWELGREQGGTRDRLNETALRNMLSVR